MNQQAFDNRQAKPTSCGTIQLSLQAKRPRCESPTWQRRKLVNAVTTSSSIKGNPKQESGTSNP